MAQGNGMTQTSTQYQLYSSKPGNNRWLPTYPVEYFRTPEEARSTAIYYGQWELKHGYTQMEYKVMKVTTIVEECHVE